MPRSPPPPVEAAAGHAHAHASLSRPQVMVDVDDKNEWKSCIDIGGVRLPTGYFFGASAATGDLSGGWRPGEGGVNVHDTPPSWLADTPPPPCCFPDNHDIISMKLYQLMVEHSPEEESQDWSKIEPSVSLLKSPKGRWRERVGPPQVGGAFLSLGLGIVAGLLPLLGFCRQHRRPHRELPGNAAHRLEGLPAPAVLAAGNRGVCCGGSCGFPEETGEEQEVLLRRRRRRRSSAG